ncbi:glycosyl hydrolase [Streptomyces sp. WAC 05379]|uniref:glycosyl hydrolase n=1 Tax=Streptomyces sp. WAC 05379 TaxID=2203207 RepID=UPI0037D9CC4A
MEVQRCHRALSDARVGWFYTWSSGRGGIKAPAGVEFVPMMHDAGSVTAAELHRAREQGRILLGFNEPDRSDQAHMTVKEALDLCPRPESTGMRLGAPAVATGGDVAGGWLDWLMKGATVRDYKVDFIPLRWYGADLTPHARQPSCAVTSRPCTSATSSRSGSPNTRSSTLRRAPRVIRPRLNRRLL